MEIKTIIEENVDSIEKIGEKSHIAKYYFINEKKNTSRYLGSLFLSTFFKKEQLCFNFAKEQNPLTEMEVLIYEFVKNRSDKQKLSKERYILSNHLFYRYLKAVKGEEKIDESIRYVFLSTVSQKALALNSFYDKSLKDFYDKIIEYKPSNPINELLKNMIIAFNDSHKLKEDRTLCGIDKKENVYFIDCKPEIFALPLNVKIYIK